MVAERAELLVFEFLNTNSAIKVVEACGALSNTAPTNMEDYLTGEINAGAPNSMSFAWLATKYPSQN